MMILNTEYCHVSIFLTVQLGYILLFSKCTKNKGVFSLSCVPQNSFWKIISLIKSTKVYYNLYKSIFG